MKQLRDLKQSAKRISTGILALLLIVSAPAPVYVYADDSCSPVAAAPTGVQQPTGADAVTYTYNSCTGLWENPHYTWNPATRVATPIVPLVYTYNSSTKQWDTDKWTYVPATARWTQYTDSVSTPPVGAKTIGGPVAEVPAPTEATTPQSSSDTGSNSQNTPAANTATDNTNTSGVTDTNNASITNQIGSTSASGNANVSGNTGGGGATSGDAQAIVNAVNMLQSSSSLTGSTAATFVINIDGDVQGDLVIDPNALQPAVGSSINNTNNLNVTAANSGAITNNITLDAQSGDANVASNTNAGNATTGNAAAIANVVNMLNSMIAANQSFMGVVNINGSLNGNILVPQSFLDTLIASNAPHQDVAISQDTLNTLNANLSNTQAIDNNVQSATTTGAANVSDNTNAGSAASGSASTNVTIFNLANNKISGGNTLLVFVNVLGKWVGVIMDAPAGSTAAAFGGALTTNTTNAANITASNTGTITNNIDARATSGNANVTNNTIAGNAVTGNAKTAVNLANITNSSINLTGWFGILFINVFGSWNGSFGLYKPPVNGKAPSNGSTPMNSQGIPQVFGFTSHTGPTSSKHIHKFVPQTSLGIASSTTTGSDGGSNTTSDTSTAVQNELASVATKVLGASTVHAPVKTINQTVQAGKNQAIIVGAVLFSSGILVLVFEQIRLHRASISKVS